jgi:capsular polysaccharide biosynthesis protein
MEIDEIAARVFRRYWHILLVAVLLPVVVVTAFYAGQPRLYAATARLVASDTLPKAAAEADAVVSEARAFATTRDVVSGAIADVHVDRQVDDVLPRISVVGLGSSPLVDISVADGDADVARTLTQALAGRVVTQLNKSRLGSAQAVLNNVDSQLTQLASRRAPLARAAELAPQDRTAQGRLAAIDRLISDLAADRNNLSLQAAATGEPRLVQQAQLPTAPLPRSLAPRLALAALLGLVVGVGLSAGVETVRPTVPAPSRVARMLGVPLLGQLGGADGAGGAALRLRLAAAQAGVRTAVLVGTGRRPLPAELVDGVAAAAAPGGSDQGRDSAFPLTAQTGRDSGTRRNGAAVHHRPAWMSGRKLPDEATGQLLTRARLAEAAEAAPQDQEARNRLAAIDRLISDLAASSDLTGGPAAAAATDGAQPARRVALERICLLEELGTDVGTSAEADAIGLVVVAGSVTRLSAVQAVQDLQAASGWPVLGILADRKRGGGARS